MNNYALVTILTNSYIEGCIAMLKSFFKHNKEFTGNLVILCCEKIKQELDIIKIYKKTKFINISKFNFEENNFLNKSYCTINNAYNANSRLEIFNLNYDKLLFVDCDIIFNKKILQIFNKKKNFLAASTSPQHLKSMNRKKYFDAGLMLIAKKFLNNKTYNNLKTYSKTKKFRDDEEILNDFFIKHVTFLDKKFNTLVHNINQKNLQNSIAIQYVGSRKPWHGNSITESFDKFTIEEILKNNKNGLIILRKLKKNYEIYR